MRDVAVTVTLLISALLLLGCGGSSGDTPQPGQQKQQANAIDPIVKAPPADWSLAVMDMAALTALREQAAANNQVLVIDCWATWCAPCLKLFPLVHAAMKERKDRVLLASLSFDGMADKKAAETYLKSQHAWDNAFIAIQDDADGRGLLESALSQAWGGGSVPAVFVYGKDGGLAYEMIETRGTASDQAAGIAKAVDAALAK